MMVPVGTPMPTLPQLVPSQTCTVPLVKRMVPVRDAPQASTCGGTVELHVGGD